VLLGIDWVFPFTLYLLLAATPIAVYSGCACLGSGVDQV
jgi:hypothetical protein